mgnify:FL=1
MLDTVLSPVSNGDYYMNYLTVYQNSEASFVEKRSEFIGYIAPVSTNEEAVNFINSIRSKHRKAKHNVYAYILRQDNISRYSDDGEPQGTAGVPVLDVLQKRGLTDVCIVVTRYFGGILLGGGGLVRAYSHCASITCDSAKIMNMCKCYHVELEMDYNLYGKVSYVLPKFEILMKNSIFENNVILELFVLEEKAEALKAELTDISNGNISIKIGDADFEDFSSVKK